MAVELGAYNDYEREFLQRSSQLPARISGLAQVEGDAAASELKEVEKDLIRAKQNLKDMEMVSVRCISGAVPRGNAPQLVGGSWTPRANTQPAGYKGQDLSRKP